MTKHDMYMAVRNGSFKISLMYPLAASKMPEDLYVKVFTLYEMLRVADIIEDSKKDISSKKELLDMHSESLCKETFSEKVYDFIITNASTKQEKAAADYYKLFFGEFIRFPDTTKEIIASTNKAMIPGMINHKYNDIKTWKQQYEYAGYVAGEVGVGLTRLFAEHIKMKNLESMIKKGYMQGIALQKVNILRDLKEDIANGRNYIPEELLHINHIERKELFTIHNMNDDKRFIDKDAEKLERQHKVIRHLSLNAQYSLEKGLEYILDIPLYDKKSPEYDYSKGIRIFSSALLLVAQEIAYDIYKDPSLTETKYGPKKLLLKYGILTPMIWKDNDKLSEKFYGKKIRIL